MFSIFNTTKDLLGKKNNLYPNSNKFKLNDHKDKCYINKDNNQNPISKTEHLNNKSITSSDNSFLPLGFTNQNLSCWLNSSLKVLFEMINITDILKLSCSQTASSDLDSEINKVRACFIELWFQYNNYNGKNKDLKAERLEQIKNCFIMCLQKFACNGNIESDGLKEYFLSSDSNKRQDTNLFLMAMERILFINNEKHSLKVSTYIDAVYSENNINKDILRRSSFNSALIIKIAQEHDAYNSINEYINMMQKKENNIYHWSKDELLQHNIVTNDSNDIPLRGNKFEIIETNFAELNSFIVYFSLDSMEPSIINQAHNKIIKMLLTNDFPRDYINVHNSKDITDERKLNVTAKAIICFSGCNKSVHYICITINGNKLIKHDDKRVSYIEFRDKKIKDKIPAEKHIKYLIASFLDQRGFTPYAVLYTVK